MHHTPISPIRAARPRDLGPPNPAELAVIARILVRHGHRVRPAPPKA